jgi:hypothetical protein
MLPNISPDSYFYLQLAIASLFAIFLITISWGTKTKYFKDYGRIERKNKKKKG